MTDHLGGTRSQQGRGAYGANLASCFGVVEVPSFVQRSLHRDAVAASHVRLDEPRTELTQSVRCENAYLLTVHLRDLIDHELWLDDRLATAEPLAAGVSYLYELDRDPKARVFQAAETLHFFLPRHSLDSFAAQHGWAPIGNLSCKPGVGVDDPVMRHLGAAVLGLLRDPSPATGVLLDQILSSVCARVIITHGGGRPSQGRFRGLAPWQERRAKEMMDSQLDASLAELAAVCGLSVTHFARGFRQSTGLSPHQWLLERRVEKAAVLLRDSKLPISEIALACGFSSQSHLTRVFSTRVGTPPGIWRRSR